MPHYSKYCIYTQYTDCFENGRMAETPLNELLHNTQLWRASSLECAYGKNHSSGFAQLDAQLPGEGWPRDGVTELLHNHYGIGEFRLLMPTLANLSQEENRWILLVKPPYIPFPPALNRAGVDLKQIIISQPKTQKDYLWVLEKALASQSCSAVIAWPRNLQPKQIRRLQLASKEGNCWGVLYRTEQAAANASPAELRIRLRPAVATRDNSRLGVKILKRRGGWESEELIVDFDDELQRPMPRFSDMIIDQPIDNSTDSFEVTRTPGSPPPHAPTHEYQ